MPDWDLAPGKSKCSFFHHNPWGTMEGFEEQDMVGEMREREGQLGVKRARPPNQGRWGKSLLTQSKVQSVSGKTGLVRKEWEGQAHRWAGLLCPPVLRGSQWRLRMRSGVTGGSHRPHAQKRGLSRTQVRRPCQALHT